MPEEPDTTAERPIPRVRGTREWLPEDCARLAELERTLLDAFERAGYVPLRTPILEVTELHERKSGAGIVARLYELANGMPSRTCLRPELTAGIVRAYTAATEEPPLPWRVSLSGTVFRRENDPGATQLREFRQVGVEMLGAGGPAADAEVIALALYALREAGINDATVRIGHVGLILEMLERSGLPPAARASLVEVLSEAAAEGGDVRALETALERLRTWLRAGSSEADEILPSVGKTDDGGVDRLFRHLVPDVTGRRSGHEIIGRLRRKWDLVHSLERALDRVKDRVRALAELRGPTEEVLERLERDYEEEAPGSVGAIRSLLHNLAAVGIASEDIRDRITLDLGFGRGIGFYSQMIFEVAVPTTGGPVEVCGGGRYDGLARVLGSDRDDRGIGFAFGLERLRHALDLRGVEPQRAGQSGFLVLPKRVPGGSAPDRATGGAIYVAGILRGLGARAVLDHERQGAEAVARARGLGLARVVTCNESPERPDAFQVRDVATGGEALMSGGELERLARDEAEGRR